MTDARRLVRHHPEHVAPHLHLLLGGVAPIIDDLCSFSAKTALTFFLVRKCLCIAAGCILRLCLVCCLLSVHSQQCTGSSIHIRFKCSLVLVRQHRWMQEVFETLGHALDNEVEPLVPLLLRKAGAVSTGRDHFLASQADRSAAAIRNKHMNAGNGKKDCNLLVHVIKLGCGTTSCSHAEPGVTVHAAGF